MISLMYANICVNCFTCYGYVNKSAIIEDNLYNLVKRILEEMMSIVEPYILSENDLPEGNLEDILSENEYNQRRYARYLRALLVEYRLHIINCHWSFSMKLSRLVKVKPIMNGEIEQAIVRVPGIHKKRVLRDRENLTRNWGTIIDLADILAKLED